MIYNVRSKVFSSVSLWKLGNGEFRISKFDSFIPIMIGYNHTVVDSSLAQIFKELPVADVEVIPITIIRKFTNESWDGFFELDIKGHLAPEKYKVINEFERDIWQYQHSIFVSEVLKQKLERMHLDKLEFPIKFSSFG